MTLPAMRRDLVRIDEAPSARGGPDSLLDLHELSAILLRRRRLILGAMACTLLLALLYLLVVPAKYTAMSIVLADPREQRVIRSQEVLPGIGSDAAAVESQVELIQSTTLASRIAEKFNLYQDPEFGGPSLLSRIRDAVLGPIFEDSAEERAELHRTQVIKNFQKKLTANRRGLTYVLEVKFTSTSPRKAAMIANAVADAYLADQLAAKREATTGASQWLGSRIETLRERVRTAERAVADFKRKHNIVSDGGTDTSETLSRRQIYELNTQLVDARASTAEAKAKFEQAKQLSAKSRDPGSLPDALNSQVISKLRVDYAAVARVEAEYAAIYGPGHPDLKRIRSQLANTRNQIQREMKRILVSARNAYEIALSREKSLEASLRQFKERSAKVDQATVRLRELEREAQANRDLFQQFLARAKETSEQRGMQKADARIVSYAMVPIKPSSPKTMLVLAIAIVAGLAAGMGGVLIAENLDRGYRSKADLERDLGIPCLTVCPEVSAKQLRLLAGASPVAQVRGALAARFLDHSGDASRADTGYRQVLARLGLEQPGSAFANSMRQLRLGCTVARPELAAKVLLVSSALHGEGKSTVAANLARGLAKAGGPTLLIDADARAASLSELMAPATAIGLSEVLKSETSLKQASIYEPASGMFFLPVGHARQDLEEADLLVDGRLATLLGRYCAGFSHIVIDGPPVLSMMDSRFLFEAADAAVLVVEWGRTRPDALTATLNALGSKRGKIVGTVLNKAGPKAVNVLEYAYAERLA